MNHYEPTHTTIPMMLMFAATGKQGYVIERQEDGELRLTTPLGMDKLELVKMTKEELPSYHHPQPWYDGLEAGQIVWRWTDGDYEFHSEVILA